VKREIISNRFLLRPLGASDLDPLHQLWTDEGVRKFLWDNGIVPIEQTKEVLEKSARLFHDSGFGMWGVR
jgi:RimJ/RimL family protein N-acetyltransferase